MAKPRTLPRPRTRYYVGEPMVVIPLAQYERMANHLTDVALIERKTQNQQAAIKERHSLILKEVRAEVKSAKVYYKIWSSGEATTKDA